ncbi:MAG TPA: hypothetical protein PLL78_09280 [Fimbriimonadaceae bacterium]|nr:hypothetical protein [Fimbriimonadaceae bacterium]
METITKEDTGSQYQSKLRHVIGGKLLKAVVKCFAARPYKGETTIASSIASSIGVSPESFVATNGQSAIVIGKRSSAYDATQRNEALLEAERALIYETTVELDDIARMVDGTGEIEPYHADVGVVVSQLESFRSVGHMRPEVLKIIAAVAEAAGASSVELLEPRSPDADRLGFRFTFEPDGFQMELGEEPPELPVTAEGLVVVTRKFRDEAELEPEE